MIAHPLDAVVIPLYSIDGLTLINDDCLNSIDSLPPIGCVVTSPPYNFNLRIHTGKYTKRSVNEKTKYNGYYHDALSMDEYYEWQKEVVQKLLNKTEGNIFYNIQMITGNKRALLKLLGYFADNVKDIIIWDKKYAEPAMGEGVLNSRYEYVIVFARDGIKRQFDVANFERGTIDNILQIPKNNGGEVTEHNAQFPIELPATLIKLFTTKDDLILDPFAGTGQTLLAARKLGRQAIGIEINPKYYELMKNRLRQTEMILNTEAV